MTGTPALLVISAFLLCLAFVLGNAVSSEASIDLSGHMEVFSSGFDEIKRIAANVLYLQLDEYHHIMMYQGYEWVTVTDYLPHLWLITRLNPEFPDPYKDGGYHLAVNLGFTDEGIELLRSGLLHCPDDPGISWEYAYVCWEVEYGSLRSRQENAWRFLELCGELDLTAADMEQHTSMMNANRLLKFMFEDESSRSGSPCIASHYERRINLMSSIRALTKEFQPEGS
jgi:hypothetical protein